MFSATVDAGRSQLAQLAHCPFTSRAICYSALCWADYRRYTREFGASIDIREFAKLYGYKPERRRKTPRALDEVFLGGSSADEHAIAADIAEIRRQEILSWQQGVFAQRTRLNNAERVLASAKPTKKAADDQRIAGKKIKQFLRWLSDAERQDAVADDRRIYPGLYVPVMIWENGGRVVKPMRFQCRMRGWTEKVERDHAGTYNARRDSLDKSWSKHWGKQHAVIVIDSFFEHVLRHQAEGRELAPGEAEQDVVIQFRPNPPHDMVLACLYSDWGDAPGDLLSFAFITDEPPSEVLAAGHDRCIIPLRRENIDEWLQPNGNLARMQEILDDRERPYYEHRLAA